MDIRKILRNALGVESGRNGSTTLQMNGNNDLDLFGEKTGRSRAQIQQYQRVFNRGGYVATACERYPQYMLMESIDGFEVKSEDDSNIETIAAMLNQSNEFYNTLYRLILDAVVCGDGMAEIVRTSTGMFVALNIKDPAMFTSVEDRMGNLQHYIYTVDPHRPGVVVDPKDVLHITLRDNMDYTVWGNSFIGTSFDDIIRDTTVIESVTNGINRHGTPKYDITIGTEDEPVDDDDMQKIIPMYKNINSRTEILHTHDVDMKMLDTSSISGVRDYSFITMERVLAGLGVPAEVVSISSAANIGTAKTVSNTFMKSIIPLQKKLNSQLYQQLFKDLVGNDVPVYLDFGLSSELTTVEKFNAIKSIQNPMNPFLLISEDEQRSILGYPPREDDDLDIIDEPEDEE